MHIKEHIAFYANLLYFYNAKLKSGDNQGLLRYAYEHNFFLTHLSMHENKPSVKQKDPHLFYCLVFFFRQIFIRVDSELKTANARKPWGDKD